MIKVAVCDDNEFICSFLEEIILEYAKDNFTSIDLELFADGEKLIDFIDNNHPFDLIFLDIELSLMSGVDVGRVIRNEFKDYVSKIIFISGAKGYEAEMLSLSPFGFLKKPIQKEIVLKYLDIVNNLINDNLSYFNYTYKKVFYRINYNDILYFESNMKKIKIVTVKGDSEYYGSLSDIKRIVPDYFVTTHKSYLVNMKYITRVFSNYVFINNEIRIPISKRNLKDIKNVIIKMTKEKCDE